jgi:hypothetical protein
MAVSRSHMHGICLDLGAIRRLISKQGADAHKPARADPSRAYWPDCWSASTGQHECRMQYEVMKGSC